MILAKSGQSDDSLLRFAMEYAPLGDLTSNFQDGKDLGETYTKRVTYQVGQGKKGVRSPL